MVRLTLPPELVSAAESVGIPLDLDLLFCINCLDQFYQEEETEKKLDQDVRSGSRCYLCYGELNSPGGTAVSLGETLRRVCPVCKCWVESWRREGGQL
jgi:hypothetical protein